MSDEWNKKSDEGKLQHEGEGCVRHLSSDVAGALIREVKKFHFCTVIVLHGCVMHALYMYCTYTVHTLYMHCTCSVQTLYLMDGLQSSGEVDEVKEPYDPVSIYV